MGRRQGPRTGEATGQVNVMDRFVKWTDVKNAIRNSDPEHDSLQRVAARAAHREQTRAVQRGLQLAEERKRLGLSQSRVAQLMGISQAAVSKIESEGISDMDTVRRYAEALGGRMYSVIEIEDHLLRVA